METYLLTTKIIPRYYVGIRYTVEQYCSWVSNSLIGGLASAELSIRVFVFVFSWLHVGRLRLERRPTAPRRNSYQRLATNCPP